MPLYNIDNTVDIERYKLEVQTRVLNALKNTVSFNVTLERSENYLAKKINSKVSLVIFYADLVNSTVMSNTLPVKRLATIIQTFAQEMTLIVENFNGYTLKYVGDAVLSYFPTEKNYYLACDTTIECSLAMINIIKDGINPILTDYGYPELEVKIGIDAGEHVVIRYGNEKRYYIDIIGYPISMAAKITEHAKPNQILISNNVYQALHPMLKRHFHEIELQILKYYLDNKGEPYKAYGT